MPAIPLKVIGPPSGDAARRAPEAVGPLFRGNGDKDYACGNCGAVIASRMGPAQRVIIDTTTCPGCGAVNEFPPDLRA